MYYKDNLLCISPGHGGTDSGANAFSYVEKNLTLIISKRVAELLSEFKPFLMRSDDTDLGTITSRALSIKDKYDYCLDIHLNAGGGSGIECIPSLFSTLGNQLARIIEKELQGATGLTIRTAFANGRKSSQGNYDYYAMHRVTGKTTTVIIECLFLDNASDIKQLNIELIANAIAGGFKKFIETQLSIDQKEPAKYYVISQTNIIEIDPMLLEIEVQDKAANEINLPNFVTSCYQMMQANGEAYPLGILVSQGKVIQNRQPHDVPAGTFIVYKDGRTDVKSILDITQERNVWFAVSGCTILPEIRTKEEGFTGIFSDIVRPVNRPVIGYSPAKNKAIIAVRPYTDINRAQTTLINLECTKGITLDAGGSTVLRVENRFIYYTTKQLYSVITFR